MNRKQYKKVKAKTKFIIVEWLKSLVNEEEAKKITIDNYKTLMPNQTHFYANSRWNLQAFSERWVIKKIKKLLRKNPELSLDSITIEDLA